MNYEGRIYPVDRPIIVSVDFDGTLCEQRYPEIGRLDRELISVLRDGQEAGAFRLILNTCRGGKELEAALEVCRTHRLALEAVNENLPDMIEKFGHDPRKVYADIYLDDHNAGCRAIHMRSYMRAVLTVWTTENRRAVKQQEAAA